MSAVVNGTLAASNTPGTLLKVALVRMPYHGSGNTPYALYCVWNGMGELQKSWLYGALVDDAAHSGWPSAKQLSIFVRPVLVPNDATNPRPNRALMSRSIPLYTSV